MMNDIIMIPFNTLHDVLHEDAWHFYKFH